MSTNPNRSTWTTETIRAADLADTDTVLIGGIWREIFDVWKDGDDPARQFGEGTATALALLAKIDWSSPCWVGVRYLNEERSTPDEIEDDLHFFRLRELVQVQREVPVISVQRPLPHQRESE